MTHIGHLDVLARGVVEMIAADGKRVAVAAENEDMQVRTRKRNAAGKRQRAAMNEMRAVRLHEIRETAGAADARDGGDFLVPHLALLNQLEIKREHGEVAAAGAPRRMVGGDFLFGQALAFLRRRHNGRVGNGSDVAGVAIGNFSSENAHRFCEIIVFACRPALRWRGRGFPSPSRSGRRSC